MADHNSKRIAQLLELARLGTDVARVMVERVRGARSAAEAADFANLAAGAALEVHRAIEAARRLEREERGDALRSAERAALLRAPPASLVRH